jgi:predicted ATPase
MLKRLEVKNFKSLVDFSIDFEPFTVLIGQNGSGKSTVLQALDLLGAFLKGNVNHYLRERGWEAQDLSSKTNHQFVIYFVLTFEVEGEVFQWKVSFSVWEKGLRVETEQIVSISSSFCFHSEGPIDRPIEGEPKSGSLMLWDANGLQIEMPKIGIAFFQSILRAFQIRNAPPEIERVTAALEKIFLLDIESTDVLRKPAKDKRVENIGTKGEHLAAYLHSSLLELEKRVLQETLKLFIPQIKGIITHSSNGVVWFVFEENFPKDTSKIIQIDAAHISDGTLHLLALLTSIQGANEGTVLLLDEIENGVDPNHVSILVSLLEEAVQKKGVQVILATHSPVVLNYVKEIGINYLSRTEAGNVIASKLFEREDVKSMLEYMGPGEVWLNLEESDLTKKD